MRDDDSQTLLPPIIPLLIYHGEGRWNEPLEMAELLADDAALHAYGPRFSCHLTEEEVRAALRETLPDEGETIMSTLASKWCEKGREEGREEGNAEGREEGVILTLNGLLAYRFGPTPAELTAQLQTLPVDQLQSLSLFVLDATSIEQDMQS